MVMLQHNPSDVTTYGACCYISLPFFKGKLRKTYTNYEAKWHLYYTSVKLLWINNYTLSPMWIYTNWESQKHFPLQMLQMYIFFLQKDKSRIASKFLEWDTTWTGTKHTELLTAHKRSASFYHVTIRIFQQARGVPESPAEVTLANQNAA